MWPDCWGFFRNPLVSVAICAIVIPMSFLFLGFLHALVQSVRRTSSDHALPPGSTGADHVGAAMKRQLVAETLNLMDPRAWCA
jgi:hypothetical protein